MPPLTGFVGRLAYAILAGIIAFLVVLALGLLILHFVISPEGQDYGNVVKGLSVIIGILVGVWYFFGRPAPTSPAA